MFEFGIVIALDEGEGDLDGCNEGLEGLREMGRDAAGGVEQIAGDDEMFGVSFVNEVLDAGEIAFVIPFGDGQAAGAEGGGFS